MFTSLKTKLLTITSLSINSKTKWFALPLPLHIGLMFALPLKSQGRINFISGLSYSPVAVSHWNVNQSCGNAGPAVPQSPKCLIDRIDASLVAATTTRKQNALLELYPQLVASTIQFWWIIWSQTLFQTPKVFCSRASIQLSPEGEVNSGGYIPRREASRYISTALHRPWGG